MRAGSSGECRLIFVGNLRAMSGPKCVSYSWGGPSEAELRERAAIARGNSLVERLNSLQSLNAARREHGLEVVSASRLGDFPADGTVGEMETWNEAVAAVLAHAELEVAQAKERARQEELRRRIAAVAPEATTALIRQRAEDDRRRAAASRGSRRAEHAELPGERVDRSAEIAALIDVYPAGASSGERVIIDERLMALTRVADAEFSSAVVGVKAEIQRVGRAIADRAEMARRAEQLVATLEGLAGAQVDASRETLRRVIAGETPLLDPDVAAVARARDEAAADYERRFVASRIEDAFRECGFEVGAEFVTDVVRGEETYFASRSSGEHAVGVRMREGLLDLRVVRGEGAPDASRDTHAEVEFCKDVGRVSAELHRHGVDVGLVSQRSPGEVPMEVVGGARSTLRARSRAADRARPQLRSRAR